MTDIGSAPRKFRLGRKPRREDPRTLQLRTYLAEALPAPPASCTLYKNVTVPWGMDLNDTEGDCTIAAAAHMVMEWTGNAKPPPVVIPDAAIQAAYNVVDGGVDQGADMLTVLNYWRQTGIGSDKISAFVEVDQANHDELMQAVSLFGGVYLGVELPDFAVQGDMLLTPWTLPPQDTTYPPGNPSNGHCIAIVGYNEDWLYAVTWGEVKQMAWGFLDAYADEAFAVLSPDWIDPQGETPAGLNLTQLQADLAAVTQNPAPNPPPPAPPTLWARLWAYIEALFHFGKKARTKM